MMISIIIPTLNEEKIIARTLTALRAGITLSHQFIVSDGGSTDQTVEIAKLHADVVLEHTDGSRQTIAQGRNAGAAVAKGDFLVFLDADCSLEDPEDFFRRALANFADPKLVAVTGWLRVLPGEATLADRVIFYLLNSWMLLVNNVFGYGTSPGGEFQMIRTEVFRRIGGYKEHLVASEDIELFRRLSAVGRTHLDKHLKVFHTGRRAHKLGWLKLLTQWFLNTIFMTFRDRAFVKEWKEVR